MRDEEVAEQTGHPLSGVVQRRHHKGIALAVRQKRLWTAAEERLLGTAPDVEIAARLKRTLKGVAARRCRLKRARVGPPIVWSPEEEALLGTMSDAKLARKLGRSKSAVRFRRRRLGIRIFAPLMRAWTPEDDKLLGSRPDAEVAQLLGRSLGAVWHRRIAQGIRPCARQRRQARAGQARGARHHRQGGHYGLYTEAEERLLGKMPDAELAQRLGRTPFSIQARRIALGIAKYDAKLHQWTAAENALLGKMTDGEVAKRLGLTQSAVAHRRRRLRLPVRFAHRKPWTPEEDALLGTASDTEIALRLGRHCSTVCIRRQKLGIPNWYWIRRLKGRERRL